MINLYMSYTQGYRDGYRIGLQGGFIQTYSSDAKYCQGYNKGYADGLKQKNKAKQRHDEKVTDVMIWMLTK
jgi:hypothetical protein